MGKPLNNRMFGALAQSKLHIAVTNCWIPGEGSANATSYVLKQTGTHSYLVKNSVTSAQGIVTLVQAVSAAGQAQITVAPFGASYGASVGLTMGVLTATFTNAGTGYTAGDVLTIVGGTHTTAATVTVSTVASGVITAIAVGTAGIYSVLPTSPATVTGGTGTGATITLSTYKVVGATILANGSGYTTTPSANYTLAVTGGGGSGATLSSTATAGDLATVAVTAAGTGYTSIPTVAVASTVADQNAKQINTFQVFTFEGNEYVWKMDGTVPDAAHAAISLG